MFSIIIEKLWDIVSWLFGWRSRLPEGALVGFRLVDGIPADVEGALPADGMLAYVLREENGALYVPEDMEDEAAAALDATINGDTWSMVEDDQVIERKRKVPPPGPLGHEFPSIVKWVYWKGFKCTRVRRGRILKLYKPIGLKWDGTVEYKLVSYYGVTEDGDYCLLSNYATCKFTFVDVTGRFREKNKRGKWKWETRTRKLGKCAR